MTYTQKDFERDVAAVSQACEGDAAWDGSDRIPCNRIIAAYRDLVAEVKRSHDAILALTAENERLSELMEWREKEIADRHASLVYALKQENERLREQRIIVNRVKRVTDSGFDLLDELDHWKARAEAAERVCEEMVDYYEYDPENHHWRRVMDALAAWEATTPLHANTADVTVLDSNFSSQLTSEVTSAACEEGAE